MTCFCKKSNSSDEKLHKRWKIKKSSFHICDEGIQNNINLVLNVFSICKMLLHKKRINNTKTTHITLELSDILNPKNYIQKYE